MSFRSFIFILHEGFTKMMNYPKYCRDCKWSVEKKDSYNYLNCSHPLVNADDAYALSSIKLSYVECQTERRLGMFKISMCGKIGKLWEAKNV